jgi:hypothetical protein
MAKKKYSLLSHKPDWRYRSAISGKTTLEEVTDPLIRRYLQAKSLGFSQDPELFAVIDMDAEDRGLIEALYLGGANIDDIAMCTGTVPSVVKLIMEFFYDVDGMRKSPILRSQLANKEMNRVVRSYKVFAAKFGWKKFLEQFLNREEAMVDPPSVPEAQTDLMIELRKKITELGVYETGTPESKELMSWMKLMIELMRETRAHDWETDREKDTDIGRIMSYLKDNDHLAKGKFSFDLIVKGTNGEVSERKAEDESSEESEVS